MEGKIVVCGRELRFVMQPGVFANKGLDYGSRLLLEYLVGKFKQQNFSVQGKTTEPEGNVSVQGETTKPVDNISEQVANIASVQEPHPPRRSDSNEVKKASRIRGDIAPSEYILDLGCGCGVLGISLACCLPMSIVYMVDADIRAVRNSRLNAKLNGVKNVEIGIGDWTDNLPEGLRFGLVVSNPPTHQGQEVLEKLIDGGCSVLNSGGEFWVVMNRMTSMMKQLESKFGQVEVVKKKKGYMVVRSFKN